MSYSAAMALAGVVGGGIASDTLAAVPTAANVPATGASSRPKATADGTPVGGAQTPRQALFLSAAYVVVALAILLFGARFLKDARIG